MKVKHALILFVFVVSSVTPAFAGWKLTMASPRFSQALKSAEASNPNAAMLSKMPGFDTITVLIDGDKAKMSLADGWAWAIMDYGKESFALGVDAEKAQAMFEQFAMMVGKGGGAADMAGSGQLPNPAQQAVAGTLDELLTALEIALAPLAAQMQAEMAKIPPDQLAAGRAQMQAAFDESASLEMKLKQKTGSIPIAGCDTVGYDIYAGGKQTTTAWYCPTIDMELIKKESGASTKKFADWLQKTFDKMSGGLGITLPTSVIDMSKQQALYDEIKGFPFEMSVIDPQTGETVTALVVTSAKQMKVPATEFAVPQGYKITRVGEAIAGLSAVLSEQMSKMKTMTANAPGKPKKSKGKTIVMNNNERQ